MHFRNNLLSYYPVAGTPGGDLGELAMGVYIYNNMTGRTPDYASVKALFQQVGTPLTSSK
jgi:hypothetical protein